VASVRTLLRLSAPSAGNFASLIFPSTRFQTIVIFEYLEQILSAICSMLKRIGLFLIVLGLCGLTCTLMFIHSDRKLLTIFGSSSSVALAFLGIACLAIQSNPANRSKYKRVFFIGSLVLMGFSILSKYQQWPGANLEGVLAIFFYCFAYAPLELYLKNAKWRQYSTNTWEMLLLSSLDFLGVNLILIGLLTRVLHWPGQYYLIYPGCVLLLARLILWNLRFKKEVILRKLSEDKIKTQYQEIEREKQISDNLLLNILPAEVAEELKSKGHTEAKLFDEVTVLFTDFEDFTHHSEQMTAKELVAEINTCFSAFDQIMETFGVEKIKTIGDSYMCAGGLPVANNTHAVDVVNAGLAIQQFILNRMEQQAAIGIQPFQIRIGFHTGPVVAGIVGIKKFAYDIWGDTVNTASRMESNGQAGKVNISGTTYQLVKDHFAASHRGKIQVKGKGELDMYFVERNLRQA